MRKSNELVTLFMEGSLFNLMANYLKEELKGKGGEITKFSILGAVHKYRYMVHQM